jgi:hypothetical protein
VTRRRAGLLARLDPSSKLILCGRCGAELGCIRAIADADVTFGGGPVRPEDLVRFGYRVPLLPPTWGRRSADFKQSGPWRRSKRPPRPGLDPHWEWLAPEVDALIECDVCLAVQRIDDAALELDCPPESRPMQFWHGDIRARD